MSDYAIAFQKVDPAMTSHIYERLVHMYDPTVGA